MTETIRMSAEEIEMAEIIGLTPSEYYEAKKKVEAEAPLLKALTKMFAKHRGKKKPTDKDEEAAALALYKMIDLGWILEP